MCRSPAALALAALAVIGCGGPSEQEFVASADAVCRQAQRQAARVRPPPDGAGPAQTALYVRRLTGLSRRQFAALRQIEAPERLKPGYHAFLASGRRGVRLLEQLRDRTLARDPRASQRLVGQLDSLTRQANRQALAVGLRRCGS